MCIRVEGTGEGSSKSIALRHNVCVCVCACTRMLTCMAVSNILPYPYVTRMHILIK